jgi:sulfite reductase (ferredoxin)
MQSFRTELENLENPIVEKDIIDLERKIKLFRDGAIPDEKFRSLRLARGIYGQRQPGVQMIRIKLPFGRMTFDQWNRIADVSDEYATGNLHLTTRQDIQIHFVSLDRTPDLWAKLEEESITIREACGNTVRNITASDQAGIDPLEPFDVTPYAHAAFVYFLRNPICQDMGRKFKIAFASSEKDSAFTFIHDIGVIPKVRYEQGREVRGFKVLLGGGLGAQPFLAQVVYEFLEADQLIPYIECVLRVFDRYGERASRGKARLKFLIQKMGLDEFGRLVEEERVALKNHRVEVDAEAWPVPEFPAPGSSVPPYSIRNPLQYEAWKNTNVFEQKQQGYFGAYVRVSLGDLPSGVARELIVRLRPVAADDVRVTVNQGLLFRYIRPQHLPYFFSVLESLGLGAAGFDSVADVTACPGTDTCNLGITSSTGIASVLEKVVENEFPELLYNTDIKIKISGCMNSCGQHSMAGIGFHGSSMKSGSNTVPALQVCLGGGVLGDGRGRISDKVIKIPSKRGPEVLRVLLKDYEANREPAERYHEYFDRKSTKYFYELLKPLADLSELTGEDLVDWGRKEKYATAIGVGECAGVVIDLVQTLLFEAEEKIEWAEQSLEEGAYADGIYHTYSAFVQAAKALLLGEQISCNTQAGILRDFDKHFSWEGASLSEVVLQINKNAAGADFGWAYLQQVKDFYAWCAEYRRKKKEVPAEALVQNFSI